MPEADTATHTSGDILDVANNHGVGLQIIHFAKMALVAPVFY